MTHSIPAPRFELHRARLTMLARGWLGNHADAQDAVQDTWLRVQAGVPAGLGSDVAWLVAVLRNVCVDRLRRRDHECPAAGEPDQDDAQAPSAEQSALLRLDARAALRRLAALLAPDDVVALLLHVVFDFDHRELAQLSGRAEGAVRQRLHRALRRVRATRALRGRDGAAPAEDRDAIVALCWRALQRCDPGGLVVQLRAGSAPTPPERALPATAHAPAVGSAAGRPRRLEVRERDVAVHGDASLVQAGGGLLLAWFVDGVMIGAMPVGVSAAADSDTEADIATA